MCMAQGGEPLGLHRLATESGRDIVGRAGRSPEISPPCPRCKRRPKPPPITMRLFGAFLGGHGDRTAGLFDLLDRRL